MQQLQYCLLLCFEVFYGLYSLSMCVYTAVQSAVHTHLLICTGMSLHMATEDGLPPLPALDVLSCVIDFLKCGLSSISCW